MREEEAYRVKAIDGRVECLACHVTLVLKTMIAMG